MSHNTAFTLHGTMYARMYRLPIDDPRRGYYLGTFRPEGASKSIPIMLSKSAARRWMHRAREYPGVDVPTEIRGTYPWTDEPAMRVRHITMPIT